jgi:hypothetical protein
MYQFMREYCQVMIILDMRVMHCLGGCHTSLESVRYTGNADNNLRPTCYADKHVGSTLDTDKFAGSNTYADKHLYTGSTYIDM